MASALPRDVRRIAVVVIVGAVMSILDTTIVNVALATLRLDLNALARGDRLRVGGCLIEITGVRIPCTQLKKWHADLPKMIAGRSGSIDGKAKSWALANGRSAERIGSKTRPRPNLPRSSSRSAKGSVIAVPRSSAAF